MCRSFLLENRWPANTLAGRQAGWKYTRRALHALIHMHACAFVSKHTWAHTYMNAQTHTRHDKITNVLHCCVQDLTMWESNLLVRVCSGCCCNQRSPKAWPSHRKSSASSAATSCLCGRNLEGEPGERDSIAVAPDLISCAAVAATVAPLPLRRTSFPLSLKMNENMHY